MPVQQKLFIQQNNFEFKNSHTSYYKKKYGCFFTFYTVFLLYMFFFIFYVPFIFFQIIAILVNNAFKTVQQRVKDWIKMRYFRGSL